jgi:hypothetical protein
MVVVYGAFGQTTRDDDEIIELATDLAEQLGTSYKDILEKARVVGEKALREFQEVGQVDMAANFRIR